MGSGYVLTKEGSKRPQAITQAIRGEKTIQRFNRFESVVKQEFDKYLKLNGGQAPDVHQLKKLVTENLEYGEGWISSLISFFYFECATGRQPNFKLEKRIYIVPR